MTPDPRRVVLALALLVPAGCSRDFSLPAEDLALALAPDAAVVSPCEPLSFSVVGGRAPYRFAFPSGPRSGLDATLDTATGAYRAGSAGQNVDVVRVIDADGRHAEAHVTVGPHLSASPSQALVAPGDSVRLTVTGGKAPYRFELEGETPAGELVADGAVATYRAGERENALDVIRVWDDTGIPAASITVQVMVGRGLTLMAPGLDRLAPRQRVVFTAVGGRAPYTFAVHDAPSGGGFVDPTAGLYEAGPVGAGTDASGAPVPLSDTVRVTDAAGASATATVEIGPALSVRLETDAPSPGEPVHLLAEGGLPPYAFSFGDRGNRSGGAIESVTGVYRPGYGVGATDVLRVVDATGRAWAELETPPVGPVTVQVAPSSRAALADLDGDGRDDELVAITHDQPRYLWTAKLGTAADAQVRRWYVHSDPSPANVRLVADLDGDGHDDVVIGSAQASWVLFGTLDGGLRPGPEVYTEGFWLGARREASAEGPVWRFYSGGPTSSSCGLPTHLLRTDWVEGSDGPRTPVCVPLSEPVGPRLPQTGDFDGDGLTDIFWTTVGSPRVDLAFGPDFVRRSSLDLGDMWAANGSYVADDLDGDGVEDLLLVATLADGETTRAFGFRGGSFVPFAPVELAPPGEAQLEYLVSFHPAPGQPGMLLAWTPYGGRGRLHGFELEGDAWVPAHRQPPSLDAPLQAAALGDGNADGAPDLVLLPAGSDRIPVYWGEGDGSFGRRPRFGTVTTPRFADLDGDALLDAVDLPTSGVVDLRYGTEGQLALVGRRSVPTAPEAPSLVDVDGDGALDLLFAVPGEGLFAMPLQGDGFGEPRPLAVTAGDDPEVSLTWAGGPARFGGVGGFDLLLNPSRESLAERAFALIVEGPFEGRVIPVHPPSTSYCPVFGTVLGATGYSDVIAACRETTFQSSDYSVVLYRARPELSAGRLVGFGAWQEEARRAFTLSVGPKLIDAGGPLGARVYLLPSESSELPPELFVVHPEGTTSQVLDFEPVAAAAADGDGDGVVDVVVSDDAARLHVFRFAAGVLSPVRTLAAPGRVVAVGSLGGSGPVAVVQAGEDLLALPLDGSG